MVLKGSKVYFYKPPHDRAHAIKELFPSGLVAVVEGDENDEEPVKLREDTRKKRAFWGRRTHPDLVLKDGIIESGPFEALVHECVFGTTFSRPDPESSTQNSLSEKWKSFASTILMCLPYLIDRARFEYEFQRCVGYLVSGANEAQQEFERDRVSWLAGRYVELHGSLADAANWRAFLQDVLPGRMVDTSSIEAPDSTIQENPETPSTTTPLMSPTERFRSPSKTSLFQTPSSRATSASPSKQGISSSRRVKPLLDQAGLTLEAFLKLDHEIVSHSLVLHSRATLRAGKQLTADVLLAEMAMSPLTEFFGCDEAPHWLTRLVVSQILGPGPRGTRDNGKDIHSQNSRTHVRAEIIGRWARVAEQCRHAGDECSWKAIMDALCSKPVARLEKAWRRTDAHVLSVVRSWVHASSMNEPAKVQIPKITFWGGGLRHKALKIIEELHDGKSNDWHISPMQVAKQSFDEVKTLLGTCAPKHDLLDAAPDNEDLLCLVQLWKDMSKEPLHPKIRQ